jgi:hypothetical protein
MGFFFPLMEMIRRREKEQGGGMGHGPWYLSFVSQV